MPEQNEIRTLLRKLLSNNQRKSLIASKALNLSLNRPEHLELVRELAACYGLKFPQRFSSIQDIMLPALIPGKTHSVHFIVDTCAVGEKMEAVRDAFKICRLMRKYIRKTEALHDAVALETGGHSFNKIHFYLDVPLLLAAELTGTVNYDEINKQNSDFAKLITQNHEFVHFPTSITEHGINLGYEQVMGRYVLSSFVAQSSEDVLKKRFQESADISIILTLLKAAREKDLTEQAYIVVTNDKTLKAILEALQTEDGAKNIITKIWGKEGGKRLHQQLRAHPEYLKFFKQFPIPLGNICVEVISPHEFKGFRTFAQVSPPTVYEIMQGIVAKNIYGTQMTNVLPHLMQRHAKIL